MDKKVEAGINELSKDKEKAKKEFEDKEVEIKQKIDTLKGKYGGTVTVGQIEKFFNRLELLWMCVKDYYNNIYTDIPWRTIAALIFALLYFVNPIDLIPDFLPIIGFVDDSTVLYLVWKAIEADLKKYVEWKKLPLADYF
ncbi:MAG: YkvA family protein [bacterium]